MPQIDLFGWLVLLAVNNAEVERLAAGVLFAMTDQDRAVARCPAADDDCEASQCQCAAIRGPAPVTRANARIAQSRFAIFASLRACGAVVILNCLSMHVVAVVRDGGSTRLAGRPRTGRQPVRS